MYNDIVNCIKMDNISMEKQLMQDLLMKQKQKE